MPIDSQKGNARKINQIQSTAISLITDKSFQNCGFTVVHQWYKSRAHFSIKSKHNMRLLLLIVAAAAVVQLSAGALSVVQQFLTRNDYNLKYKYGSPQTVKWITIHNTANKASARNEAAYLNNRQDNQYISFHYVVDDKEALHLLPDNMLVVARLNLSVDDEL